jgi:transposase
MATYGAYFGIDVAKSTLQLAQADHPRSWQRPNTVIGWQQIVHEVAQVTNPLIVLEATGPYHRGLVQALASAGHIPVVLNPAHVKYFTRSQKRGAKTDASDARALAAYAAQVQPVPRPLPSSESQTLKDLVARRSDLVSMRTMERNRCTDQLPAFVRLSLDRMIATLTAEITELTTAIADLIATTPALASRAALLRSAPGIGPIITATLLANLPELGQLGPKQLSALAGLAPFARDSGSMQGLRYISGGRAPVRSALYTAIIVGIRRNPVVSTHYRALIARGKPHKVATIACARRLLGILNAMLRDNLSWSQTNVASTPI